MSEKPFDIAYEKKQVQAMRWGVTCLIVLPFAIGYWWPDQPSVWIWISWALAGIVFFGAECANSRLEGYAQGYSGFGDRAVGLPNRLTTPITTAPNPHKWTWVPVLLPLALWVTLGVAIWRHWI